MFSAKSLFIATVLGGVDAYVCLCVQYMCKCKSLNTRHICQCVFDFANVSVCVLTVCPSVITQ